MTIKRIEDYTMLYETLELSELLKKTLYTPTDGKVQSLAQSTYAKTQGVLYAAYAADTGEARAIVGGTRVDSTHFIVKNVAVSGDSVPLTVLKDLIDKMIDDYRFLTLEASCGAKERPYYEAMGFTCKEDLDPVLDQLVCTCTLTIDTPHQ